jgi:hypothetical protein
MQFTNTTSDTWLSTDGHYKVTYIRDVLGVKVRPHYHALVRTMNGDRPGWGFAGRRGPYYALTTATKACERHFKYWQRALKIAHTKRLGRAERLEKLQLKAREGKSVTANRLLLNAPIWAIETVEAKVLKRLFPSARVRKSQTA